MDGAARDGAPRDGVPESRGSGRTGVISRSPRYGGRPVRAAPPAPVGRADRDELERSPDPVRAPVAGRRLGPLLVLRGGRVPFFCSSSSSRHPPGLRGGRAPPSVRRGAAELPRVLSPLLAARSAVTGASRTCRRPRTCATCTGGAGPRILVRHASHRNGSRRSGNHSNCSIGSARSTRLNGFGTLPTCPFLLGNRRSDAPRRRDDQAGRNQQASMEFRRAKCQHTAAPLQSVG